MKSVNRLEVILVREKTEEYRKKVEVAMNDWENSEKCNPAFQAAMEKLTRLVKDDIPIGSVDLIPVYEAAIAMARDAQTFKNERDACRLEIEKLKNSLRGGLAALDECVKLEERWKRAAIVLWWYHPMCDHSGNYTLGLIEGSLPPDEK